MPFWKWTIEPVYLGRGNGKCEDDLLEATCNRTLVATLHQLTCLLKLAHYVFNDIGGECEALYKKTEELKGRIDVCSKTSKGLNARKVAVPAGDIDWYCQVKDHYITTYVQETDLIVSSDRPVYVKHLYEKAAATPLPLIRAIDKFRTDGVRGSKIFARTPVLEETSKKNKNLDIETRRPASFALARDWDELEITFLKNECSGPCQTVAPSRDIIADLTRLPSPEERTLAMSLEYPSTVVPIDITGNSFQRMSSLRRSLLHVDFFIKRKKQKKNKRRNTISGSTSKELEEALRKTTSKALVDTSCQTEECTEVGWFGKIFNKRNSLIKREKKSPQEENNNVLSKITASVRNRDSVNLFDSIESSKSSKKSERNSLVIKDKAESSTTKKTPSTSKSKMRSILPISTLSAAMTVAVKLRQCKKNGDDGRSSSGNWSASSSTRVSVDSDQQQVTSSSNGACSPSQSSLGKDSVLSDYTPQDTDTSRSQEGSRASRTDRRPLSLMSPKIGEDSTHSWLQSIEQDCQSGTLTPDNCPSDSTSTPHVLSPYIRRRRYCQNESSPPIMDDEGSSVYSVDTDGYYTSMHTDSGLKTRTPQHECRARRDSDSSVSTLGNVSVNSLLSRATIGRSSKSDSFREERKIPPPPPVRISSVKRDSSSDGTGSQNNGDTSTSESSDRDTVERLRKKTAINSSRYPSMCAVSPEPSDDESSKPKQVDSARGKSPPKFNMYSDQSPQNSKFVSFFRRSRSPEEAITERNQSLVTSFSPEHPEQPKASEVKNEQVKIEQIKNDQVKATNRLSISSVFTEEGRSTIKRVSLSNSDKPQNQSKSCSLIPKAIERPVARVTLDPNGRVIFSSNSLGRRRDGQPLRSPPSPVSEQKFATLPMRNSHNISSSPIIAHNGTFMRLEQPTRIKSPVHEQRTKSLMNPVQTQSEPKRNESCYKRTLCGPRLPMNGYIPTSVISRNAINDSEECSSSPNGQLPTVPPEMPPLSRFANQHSTNRNSDQVNGYRNQSAHHVPSSISVQNSLRSIASYSPYQSSIYGGVPKPTSQATDSSNYRNSLRTNFLFPHSKTAPSLSSSNIYSNLYSRTPKQSTSPTTPYNNGLTPTKQVSFSPIDRPMQNGTNSRIKQPNICTSISSPSIYNRHNGDLSKATTFRNGSPQSPTSPHSNVQQSSPSILRTSNGTASPYAKSNIRMTFNGYQSPNRPSSIDRLSPSSRCDSPGLCTFSKQSPTNKFQNSPTSNGVERKTLMTTADLFAAIHNSKKKHNIKTDLDISSSSLSSRSSSPCNSTTSTKSVLAETGFLSPRNQLNIPRDRRSWIGDYKSFSLPSGDRKSLANDRLGPPKPTSMYDFKMLLLQASRNNNDSPGARMSASERLKVQPKNEINATRSLPTSPIRTPPPILTGHSTVPIKRGSKARSSLRYDLMYQPILEDCCEETEAQKSPKTPPTRTPLETSFVNSTPSCANNLPPPQHWTQAFVPIRTANSRGASTWV
ncbi:actin remodeling regulator NHS-like isoform X1 [Centruroides vittatus]|uniref:actin remodeling regulator NHS-like isoform X1 n=1 Tax=Centruroides vittatus TaxID=120091 RepID=UPI0035108F69